LRGDPKISKATRDKVVETARRLGYVPSDLARALSTKTTRQIALVADLDNPLWPMLVEQVHDELDANGYSMTLLTERGDPEHFNRQILGQRPGGVIITSVTPHAIFPKELIRWGTPFVLINRTVQGLECDAVVPDNIMGGRQAARLLADAGHSRVGALFGPADTSSGREREQGFRLEAQEAGLELDPRLIRNGAFDYGYGTTAFPELMNQPSPPTAIFCANDIIAIGAMNSAKQLGIDIPGDVSLVGFDDLDEASWPMYDLTTIHVPFSDMVKSAVKILLSRIAGDDSSPVVEVHSVIPIVRASTI